MDITILIASATRHSGNVQPNDNIPKLQLPQVPDHLAESLNAGHAVAWSEPVEITTYDVGEPERYPMFFENRVYQGSSGKVYPMPFTESIAIESKPRKWEAIHLENRYVRLMVLPEMGGRIHVGYDKTNDYDFFYRNNVIKPALVGLDGPWVSGGVEFNWPQHHRPGTAFPVETEIEAHDDGSVTVWCSDHDPFDRMKGMHGVHLSAESSLIELKVRLFNRTSETKTFLWWANVAARVHDEYQSFFPTDIRYVADHARRAVVSFPEADRPYYGVDYPTLKSKEIPDAARLDFYRNIPVPTSYMVTDTEDSFFGGYDFKADAGFVHWADRHIAPGKKQWTWGNSPFGWAWDAALTDDDGPYVELMAGVYTDNQPDFTFIAPGETKTFSQYWYPVSRVGVIHHATTEAAVHLDVQPKQGRTEIRIGAATTRAIDARITLTAGDAELYIHDVQLAPDQPWLGRMEVDGEHQPEDVRISIFEAGKQLLSWARSGSFNVTEPPLATEPPAPESIETIEELYLTGIHLSQYRHPTRSPLPYWKEALGRDPGDIRSNLALARERYERYDYQEALDYAERALARLTRRNNNPRDGEASYLVGLCSMRLGLESRAYAAFAKAAWDVKWASPSCFEMGRRDLREGKLGQALQNFDRCLRLNADNLRAIAGKVIVLRRLGRDEDARRELDCGLALDGLDQLLRHLAGKKLSADGLVLLDIAFELRGFGQDDEASALFEQILETDTTGAGNAAPIAHYALMTSDGTWQGGAAAGVPSLELCFPNGHDMFGVLARARTLDPDDSTVAGLMGALLYGCGEHARALEQFRGALDAGTADPVVLRNAAVTVFHTEGDGDAALTYYGRALQLAEDDPRLVYESDQLLRRVGSNPEQRLARLRTYGKTVHTRDDLTIEFCDLLISRGESAEAHRIMSGHTFQPWEGGEGRALSAWQAALLALAQEAKNQGQYTTALDYAQQAIHTPPTLGEARHPLASTAPVLLTLGDILEAIGDSDGARQAWSGIYQDPAGPGLNGAEVTDDDIHAAGCVLARLGDPAAEASWQRLDDTAQRLEEETPKVDYFATSLPELLLFAEDPGEAATRRAAHLRTLAAAGRRSVTAGHR
jgi:tetratricopeptide (TPR) repeat protein